MTSTDDVLGVWLDYLDDLRWYRGPYTAPFHFVWDAAYWRLRHAEGDRHKPRRNTIAQVRSIELRDPQRN